MNIQVRKTPKIFKLCLLSTENILCLTEVRIKRDPSTDLLQMKQLEQ